MALFGKKKKAEPSASAEQPALDPADEISVVGGDADEMDIEEDNDGQVIDFDAIADELGDGDGASELGEPLDDTNASATTGAAAQGENTFDLSNQQDDDIFGQTAGFETTGPDANADDELDFDTVFDDGSATGVATSDDEMIAVVPATDENPFGAAPEGDAPTIEPVANAEAITANAPPLTHTPPMTTADAINSGNAPAVKKSLPLLPLLGAAGLLLALGFVGWTVFGPQDPPEEDVVVATNPGLQAPAEGEVVPVGDGTAPTDATAPTAPVGPAGDAVNPGIAVDGVPIVPGVVVRDVPAGTVPAGTVPAGNAPRPTVPLTPTLQKQLKDLWNQGARAKRANDFAGARAAWTRMLRLRPNHPGIQEAIDKLPPS